jgi:hypothetical protein
LERCGNQTFEIEREVNGRLSGTNGSVTVSPASSADQVIAAGANDASVSFCASSSASVPPFPLVQSATATF